MGGELVSGGELVGLGDHAVLDLDRDHLVVAGAEVGTRQPPSGLGVDLRVSENDLQRLVGLGGVSQYRRDRCRVEIGHEQGMLDGEHVGITGSWVGPQDPGARGITQEGNPSGPAERAVRRWLTRGVGEHGREATQQ